MVLIKQEINIDIQKTTSINSECNNTNNPPSILDQLKDELFKRAPFLNDSSDENSDENSDSEWK